MRRIFFISLFLYFVASPLSVFAQFTTVTGTVKDPNGLLWTGPQATISAQLITQGGTTPTLNGVSFTGTMSPVPLSSAGTFTIRLADSGVIVPSTTTWQFTVNIAPGVLPPLGTGPQFFTFTTAINCGTNTPALCTSSQMDITATITPLVPKLSNTASSITGLTTGFIVKAASASTLTNTLCDEGITTANTVTCTDTAGVAAKGYTSTGTTAGFVDYPQGPSNAGISPCNTPNSICHQAPTAVTAGVETGYGVLAQGTLVQVGSSSATTQGFSGDANHSASPTIGSGTSIGSTQLCSTTNCPVGTYRVNVYIDITTPCGTTGTYLVNLIYTDDTGASKTVPVNIQGTGAAPATGILTTTSTANFGQASQILRSTGAASINYSTTAVACGTAGPMVGKLYLSVEPVQ